MRTTRRNVLKGGGKAVAAVATLPFLSSIPPAQAQEDAELFALYERCRQLEKEHMAALNRYEEVWFPVKRWHEKLWRADRSTGTPGVQRFPATRIGRILIRNS